MPLELHDRLNAALLAKAMSQAQLANDIGVSAASVSGWCNGTKRPGVANLQAIATRLGVTPSYLQFGEGPGIAEDLDAARARYAADLLWYWRAAPSDGGRELGNAAGFAFKVDIETLGRESGQNSSDERLVAEPTVHMRYSVIELSGSALGSFLEALQFEELHPHLVAAASTTQKVSTVIAAGLERLENESRLILIKIEDYNANGLLGPEYEPGRFMAVVRNILDSYKNDTAGGSYGLGKATLWASSQLGLVLINSHLAVAQNGMREDRFIGRIDLPWHELADGSGYAGPGWFGELDPEKECTRSYWSNPALVRDLLLERDADGPGTSFLIVGAYDPSGVEETVEQIADRLRRSLADNFWPAMVDQPDDVPSRMQIVVRAQRNDRTVAEHFVDPEEFQPARVAAFRRHLEDEIVDKLDNPGDVVRVPVTLKVPGRRSDGDNTPQDHEAIVLIAQADEGDDNAGRVTYFRGSHMVIQQPTVSGLPVGARAFHAIVLAGEAAGGTPADRAAERFLRAAEPPAHDKWTSTSDVTTNYFRGGWTAIHSFEEQVRQAIRNAVREPASDVSDGPEALKELLRVNPPKPETEVRPRIKAARGQATADGGWRIEATVSLPPRDRAWSVAPIIKIGAESGAGVPVRWRDLTAKSRCVVEGDRLIADEGARAIKFAGETDPASQPLDAGRAKAYVDVRVYREAQ